MTKAISRNLRFFMYWAILKRLPCSYARWGGPLYKSMRVCVAGPLLARCGTGVNIESGASFGRGDQIYLGNESDLGIDCKLNGEVHIGNNSFMGPEVMIYSQNHAFSRTDLPIMHQGSQKMLPVFIGNDVWIGARVIILPGVHIGDHSVIGAGSIVARDIPEWSVAAGNPARVLRNRLTESGSIN